MIQEQNLSLSRTLALVLDEIKSRLTCGSRCASFHAVDHKGSLYGVWELKKFDPTLTRQRFHTDGHALALESRSNTKQTLAPPQDVFLTSMTNLVRFLNDLENSETILGLEIYDACSGAIKATYEQARGDLGDKIQITSLPTGVTKEVLQTYDTNAWIQRVDLWKNKNRPLPCDIQYL